MTNLSQRPPKDLSPWGKRVWLELLASHDFAPHELVVFVRALQWFGVADTLRLEADGLRGRERDAKLKAAGDASTAALRHWRILKFVDPARPARRPGRPSGKPWTQTIGRFDSANG